MCGIVGYIGDKQALPVLLGGLRRLEYRGYDSAGVATIGNGVVTLKRAKGKVAELEAVSKDMPQGDCVGIGHTRWATHGEPSERNAHPHHVGSIYLVHNGIIENYNDLKKVLIEKGYEFKSDTDTEVLVALVDSFYKEQDEKSLLKAVSGALQLVVGAYGIAVMAEDNAEEIVVARQGSPLIIGVGDDETYIASDASALVGYTEKAIYLKDGEMAVCRAGSVQTYDIKAREVSAAVEKIELDIQSIQKNGFDHFLAKEIHEQPETLRSTLSGRVLVSENRARLGGHNMTEDELKQIKNIIVIGCGTAYHAGLQAKYFIEQFLNDVTVQVEIASEFRYRSFAVPEGSVALIVSQSGETADTIACLQELKRRGVRCLGIVNAVGSTIAREVDGGVYVHVGAEISVASTKAFTSQTAAMVLFGLVIAEAKGAGPKEVGGWVRELDALPEEIRKTIEETEESVKQLASEYSKYEHALYVGRDTLYPAALEGSLKLKEISYIHSEGYPSGELKHGAIALIDDRFFEVCFIADNWLFEKSVSNLVEMNARGAHAIVVTNSQKELQAERIIRVSTKSDLMLPLVLNVVSQLFAYYMAVARGNDVDQPRNLAKSVTVE